MDNPGIGTTAAAADAVATIHVRPFRMSTFCFTIFADKPVRVKVRLSLLHLSNASRMAVVSRLKSHLPGQWLLIGIYLAGYSANPPDCLNSQLGFFEAELLH